MITIIAGSRYFEDYEWMSHAVRKISLENPITEIVSGVCRGADFLGERYAKNNKIPVKYFKADWAKYDKAAGPIRNQAMADYSDALILFWTGNSKGSKSMLEIAKRKGLKIFEIII